MLYQLLRRQGRAEVGVAVAHDRQCKVTNFGRQTVIAGFAASLRQQARGTVLLETAQQAKYLTPVQADQFTRVGNTQTTRSNLQQNLKPAELLLAHRHHRHGATPRTPKPEGVSPQLCTGVSSLYCVYTGDAGLSGASAVRFRGLLFGAADFGAVGLGGLFAVLRRLLPRSVLR